MKISWKDIVPGAKFGMLVVSKRLPKGEDGYYRVLCKCECGKLCYPIISNLIISPNISCGCKPKGKYNNRVYPGAKFGRLTVIERLPRVWIGCRWSHKIKCKCDCGNETCPEISPVVSGQMVSCGCYRLDNVRALARQKSVEGKLTGQILPGARFGRLVVIERIEENGYLTDKVYCSCDCGNKTFSEVDSLGRGLTKSCGCLQSELLIDRNRKLAKYNGFSVNFPEVHTAWIGMLNRCFKPNSAGYMMYGAKGITVCNFYKEDPRNFYKEIGEKPSPQHSIDRFPDGKGNYSCGHCEQCLEMNWGKNIRWATIKEQAVNRSSRLCNAIRFFVGELDSQRDDPDESGTVRQCVAKP